MRKGGRFFIALRYLWGRGMEGGRYLRGAAFGIALSLVPIVVTLIVADGMIQGITDRYLELGTGHIQIYDYHGNEQELPMKASSLSALEDVRGVWMEKQGFGILVGPTAKSGAGIRAIDPAFLRDTGTRKYLEVISGSAERLERKEALIGEELARTIGAEVGTIVRLMTTRSTAAQRIIPRISTFTIRGIVSSGYRELDALWFLIPYEDGFSVLAPDNSTSFLVLKTEDPYGELSKLTRSISEKLGASYGVYTWMELQRSHYRSLESTRQLLLFIMALVVIVAAVNVSSATSLLVIERNKDIAILKSFGMGARGIHQIFLLASLCTGLLGTFFGIAAGLTIGYTINEILRGLEFILGILTKPFTQETVRLLDPAYYLETIPVVVDWNTLGLIGLGTVLCSLVAAWIPAKRAARISPTEIIRKI